MESELAVVSVASWRIAKKLKRAKINVKKLSCYHRDIRINFLDFDAINHFI